MQPSTSFLISKKKKKLPSYHTFQGMHCMKEENNEEKKEGNEEEKETEEKKNMLYQRWSCCHVGEGSLEAKATQRFGGWLAYD